MSPAPSFEHLTGIDWFALILLAWFLVLGFVRGFVRELMRLCAWIGGLWLGRRFEGELAPFLKQNIKGLDAPFDVFVAYALIVGAVLVASWLLLRVFQSGLRRMQLQSYDRLLGAVLGTAKGLLVITFAVLATAHVPGFESAKARVDKSQAALVAARIVKYVQPLFPPSMQSELNAFVHPAPTPDK